MCAMTDAVLGIVEQLRHYAHQYAIGDSLGREIQGTDEIMFFAADMLEKIAKQNDEFGDIISNYAEKVEQYSSRIDDLERIECDRNLGCEYCQPDDCCSPLSWQYGLDHIFPDYKFCPMCGREIRAAAKNKKHNHK